MAKNDGHVLAFDVRLYESRQLRMRGCANSDLLCEGCSAFVNDCTITSVISHPRDPTIVYRSSGSVHNRVRKRSALLVDGIRLCTWLYRDTKEIILIELLPYVDNAVARKLT